MLKLKLTFILFLSLAIGIFAQDIMPYYNCGQVDGNITSVKDQVKAALIKKGFSITGGYNVANQSTLYVLTFTSNNLQNACLKVKEKGIIASNLRIGFEKIGDKVEISLVNPKYIFLGYLRKGYDENKSALDQVTADVLSAVRTISTQLTPFGGTLKESNLKDYHYMAMMPYFDDPVEFDEFDSFDQACATIEKNLNAKKGATKMVYKTKFASQKMAVYGVALLDKNTGESHFLSIIGEKNFTAMPYEIVVIDKQVSMLHGRFRFAMYWPNLSMSTFTKIMSTPGDVETTMEGLTKK